MYVFGFVKILSEVKHLNICPIKALTVNLKFKMTTYLMVTCMFRNESSFKKSVCLIKVTTTNTSLTTAVFWGHHVKMTT